MSKFDFNHVTDILRNNNEVVVTFTKVDGSVRVMRCTLKPDLLPEDYQSHNGNVLTEGDGDHQRISVFDLDVSDWRSFRFDSLSQIIIGK
jgi:hypothetical protein